METFKLARRRTSDLVSSVQSSVQQNMPSKFPQVSLPQLPSFSTPRADTVRGTWERIDVPKLPRSSHSLNVVSGAAYIFGGEINPREPVDNSMHFVRLPDNLGGGDYFKIDAVAAEIDQGHDDSPESAEWREQAKEELKERGRLHEVPLEEASDAASSKDKGKEKAVDTPEPLGNVPSARVGHASAVIGSRIFIFGGRGGPDMKPLEEAGRVWVFDTRSRTWTHLDPVPAVKGGAIVPHPAPRSYHCAASVDRPRDFAKGAAKKAETWTEWAIGDTSVTGIPQDPIVGNVAQRAVDEEAAGYGTFIVHGGCLATGDRTNDTWAFDVHTHTWTELPAAPGPSRGGTAICVSKNRLFRFGGFDGTAEIGGQLDFLQLEVELFDDGTSKGELAVRANGSWQSIIQDKVDASSPQVAPEGSPAWPEARSVSLFTSLDLGGGRENLVLCMGERSPSSDGHAGAGKFHSDVWTFQPPPQGMSRASLTGAMLQAMGRKASEGKWIRVEQAPYDTERSMRLPARRGWMAGAALGDLDEAGIVMWGGLAEGNDRLGDGWILRLE